MNLGAFAVAMTEMLRMIPHSRGAVETESVSAPAGTVSVSSVLSRSFKVILIYIPVQSAGGGLHGNHFLHDLHVLHGSTVLLPNLQISKPLNF
jgi:hypothetical protein